MNRQRQVMLEPSKSVGIDGASMEQSNDVTAGGPAGVIIIIINCDEPCCRRTKMGDLGGNNSYDWSSWRFQSMSSSMTLIEKHDGGNGKLEISRCHYQ